MKNVGAIDCHSLRKKFIACFSCKNSKSQKDGAYIKMVDQDCLCAVGD